MVFLKNYCRHKVKKGQNFKTLRQNNAVLRRAALSGLKPAPGQSSSPPNLGLHWVCPVLSFPSWTPSTNHCCYVYCSRKCSNPPTFNAESQYFISLFNKSSWLCGQQPGGDAASNARCKTGTTGHDYTDYFSIFIVFSPHCPTLYVHMGCYCIGDCIIAFPYLPFAPSIYIWKGTYPSSYIIALVLSSEGRPFHPSVLSSVPEVPHPYRRRWWNGRTTTTHGGDNSLFTCDPVSVVCFSIAKLFLCGLQEFSRASDGGLTTTETKWRHGETLWWWCVGGIGSKFLLQECTVRCTTTNSALAAPSTYLGLSLAGWPILKVQGEICEPQVDLLLLLLLLLLFYVSWLSS